MKTTILSSRFFLALGFAGVAHAGEGAARRGQVNVQAAAAKAVVAGPAVVKVYSGFSGAKVFVADAASGTDADCAAAAGRAAGTTLPADRVELVSVGAGQVACVASTGERQIELLWHAQSTTPAPAVVARDSAADEPRLAASGRGLGQPAIRDSAKPAHDKRAIETRGSREWIANMRSHRTLVLESPRFRWDSSPPRPPGRRR